MAGSPTITLMVLQSRTVLHIKHSTFQYVHCNLLCNQAQWSDRINQMRPFLTSVKDMLGPSYLFINARVWYSTYCIHKKLPRTVYHMSNFLIVTYLSNISFIARLLPTDLCTVFLK